MFEDSQARASMNQISCCCILKCFSAGESQWVLSCRCGNTVVVLMLILPLYNNSRLTLRKEYGGSPDDGHSLHLWICKAGSMNFVSQPPHTGVIYTCMYRKGYKCVRIIHISAWYKNCQWTLSISYLSHASILFAPHLVCWDVICLVLICIFITTGGPTVRKVWTAGGWDVRSQISPLTDIIQSQGEKKKLQSF